MVKEANASINFDLLRRFSSDVQSYRNLNLGLAAIFPCPSCKSVQSYRSASFRAVEIGIKQVEARSTTLTRSYAPLRQHDLKEPWLSLDWKMGSWSGLEMHEEEKTGDAQDLRTDKANSVQRSMEIKSVRTASSEEGIAHNCIAKLDPFVHRRVQQWSSCHP